MLFKDKDYVGIGQIVGLHGVRGVVKFRSELKDGDITSYTVYNDQLEEIKFTITGYIKNCLLMKIENIDDRDRARTLLKANLYIRRSQLPVIEEEGVFYYHDLLGLKVENGNEPFGIVTDIYNNGANEVIEIQKLDNKRALYVFNDATFPIVDLNNGLLKIVLPIE